MTKILILTSAERVRRFYDLASLPADWELVFCGLEQDSARILQVGADADYIFADAIQPVSAEVIQAMPNLKLIHSEGVGYNAIDCAAARARGIFVCNNRAANAAGVAEHAIMLMLAVQRRLVEGDTLVRAGRQIEAKGTFINEGVHELGSCTVGLLGFGAIAKQVALRLEPFGCSVLYNARHAAAPEEERRYGVRYAAVDEILRTADIVSLHVPVTPETAKMIDAAALTAMKPTAILINTARGEIVDQEALLEAIIAGEIAGAGLDTLSPEPVTLENPLLNLPAECAYRVTFSPHIGGTTVEAFQIMHRTVWDNIRAVEAGERPLNICNGV